MNLRKKQKSRSLLSEYADDCGQLVTRRRAVTALRAAAVESALANRAKSEFLANMSHELRTPLNAIIGFGELIQAIQPGKKSAEQSREYADHITNAGRHLLGLINDILDISKIESGSFTLEVQPVAVKPVVDQAILLSRRRIEQKQQTLDVEFSGALKPVLANERRLMQILINLLSNASKFTPENGRLGVIVKPDETGHIALTVKDNGIGMTEEEIQRALQPFTQIQSSRSRMEEGTGLGLTIARALILQHQGSFQIASTPSVGTAVTFTLPCVAVPAAN